MSVARWWALVLVGLFCLSVPAPALAQVSASAVRLRVARAGKDATGTAVWVRHGHADWLLTAYHVLRGLECAPAKNCVWVTAGPDENRLPLAKLSRANLNIFPALGVAALRLSDEGVQNLRDAGAQPAQLRDHPIACVGKQVVAIGNPAYVILRKKVDSYNYAGSGSVGSAPSVQELLPAGAYDPVAAQTQLLVIDGTTITHGYSGGPLFFQGGPDADVLLGLVQGGDPQGGTKSWAIPADAIALGLQAAKDSGISTAFAAGATWPDDGFKSSVYEREDGPAFEILSYAPDPVSIPYGKAFDLTITVRRADAEQGRDSVVTVVASNGLRVESESPPEDDGPLLQRLSWRLVYDGAKTARIKISFKLRGERFELPADVSCPPHMLGGELGADLPLGSLRANAVPPMDRPWRVRGPFSYRFGFRSTCPNCIGLRVAGPISVLVAERNTYAPVGPELISRREKTSLWGVRLEALLDSRLELGETWSLGLAAGLSGELYFYDLPESVLADGRRTVWSIPIEASVGFGALQARVRGSYGNLPTFDARYTSPAEASFPKQRALALADRFWLGASLGVDFVEL